MIQYMLYLIENRSSEKSESTHLLPVFESIIKSLKDQLDAESKLLQNKNKPVTFFDNKYCGIDAIF